MESRGLARVLLPLALALLLLATSCRAPSTPAPTAVPTPTTLVGDRPPEITAVPTASDSGARSLELLGYLGVSDLRCGSPSLDHPVASAEAAAGLPELKARFREAIAAKTALVAVLQGHLTTTQMASVLSISEATVKRLRRREADPRLVTAILLQMQLRRLVGERNTG